MANIGPLPIIGSNYIKNTALTKMVEDAFVGSAAESVNIYIDLNSVLKSVFSLGIQSVPDDNSIAVAILNMVAHYRSFFWKGYSVKTRFYFIYSLNCPDSCLIHCPEYNEKLRSKLTYNSPINIINKNIILASDLIAPRLPDVAIINGTFDTGVIMYHVMQCEDDGNPNIIITKDVVTMQVAAFVPQTIIFRPKKNAEGDQSYYIDPSNGGLYTHLASHRNVKMPELKTIPSPGLYSLLLALTGESSRSIRSTISFSKGLKALESAIAKPRVFNGHTMDILSIIEELGDDLMGKALHNGIIQKFKALDLITQYNIYQNNPERLMIVTKQRNIYDPKGLHDIIEEHLSGVDATLDVERM